MVTEIWRRLLDGFREDGALYSWAVFLAGVAGLVAISPASSWPPTPMVVTLSMVAVAATALMVPMPAGGYLTLGSSVAAAGLVLLGGPATALAMGIGFFFGNGMLHRRPFIVILSNTGQAVLSTLVARGLAYAVIPAGSPWAQPILRGAPEMRFALAMASAAFGYMFVSSMLVSLGLALRRRTSFVDVLGGNIALQMVHTFVLFVLGTVAALVITGGFPFAVLLITIPVAMISVTLLVYANRRREAEELEVMYATAGEMVRNLAVDEIINTVAAGVERLVPSDISIIYLRPPDQPRPRVAHYRGPGGIEERVRQHDPDGLAAHVLRTGRPVRVDDYEREPRRSQHAEAVFGRGAVRSALVVPIAAGGEVWGAIVLARGTRAYYTPRMERLVTTLAGQTGLAVRNAHLFHETRHQMERSATLQRLSLQVGTTLDPDETCRFLVMQAVESLEARYGFLALIDEQTRELYGRAAIGVDPAGFLQLRARLDSDSGPLQEALRAVREQRPIAGDDLQGPIGPAEALGLRDGHCALTVPLIRQGQPLGAMTVVRTDRKLFGEADIGLLEAITSRGAVAIENSRLHTDAHAQLRRLEAVIETSRRLRTANGLRDVFALIAEGTRDVLGADRCVLVVWNGQGQVADTLASGGSDAFARAVGDRIQGSLGRAVAGATAPLVSADFSMDARIGQIPEAPGSGQVKSGVFFPLRSQGELVGVLAFFNGRAGNYSSDALRLAESLADQLAVAVKNTAVTEQTEQRRDEAALLNRIVGAVNASLDLDEVFRTAVVELAGATGVPYVSIYRIEGASFRLAARFGASEAAAELPVGSGMMGRVARTGRPEFVANLRDDPDDAGSGFDVVNRAAAPITLDGTVTGVMTIEGTSMRPLTPRMYELLVALGQQVSVAVRNASFYQELRKAHDELQVLYEAARSVSGTLDLRTVLDSLVSVTCKAFGYDNGALLMVDPESGDLTVEASYGQTEPLVGKRVPSGVGITGWVARTGTPLVVDDVRQDSRYDQFDARTRSELAVPLIAEGKVLGVFNVESARLAAFGSRDLHMLMTLASYAVIAIQNAHLYEQAQRLAITDGLTELHNHRYLFDALDRLLERARRDTQPLSLIMLEIDNFKRFNDTYGHQQGDEVLRTISMLLRRGSRPSDIVARHGGDEFMVVLPGTSKTPAQETAERLRRAVEAYPLILAGDVVTAVTLSVGVATFPQDGHTVDTLVEAVDRAQYTAKRSGGNKVHVAHGS
ncbi:MAG: GAF domain-containing protein [bacterium]